MKTILIIDDCPDFRGMAADCLSDAGYDVYEADCPDEAFSILKNEQFDLIICDLHMPFTSGPKESQFLNSPDVGVRTIQELSWVFPKLPIVALSSLSELDLKLLEPMVYPAKAYSKPWSGKSLRGLIETTLTAKVADAAVH